MTSWGFVRAGLLKKLNLMTLQFQKYGMVEGTVRPVSAEASESQAAHPA